MIAGIAKMTMNDTTSIAQTKSGMRLSDMPGRPQLEDRAMIRQVATISPDTSVKVMSCAHTSARLP